MTAKKRSSKTLASGPPAASAFVPRKAFPIRIDPTATLADNAKAIARDILSPETAALRVLQAAEGKNGLSEVLDVPGALHELRRQGAELNSGDLSRVEAMLVNQATALQSLFVRLIERGMAQESLPQYETHMRLALKAQAQSRLAIETIGALKHGPAIFARQANVTNGGPMQVNNNAALPAPSGAGETKNTPSKLLEAQFDVDTRTPPAAIASNPQMEAVGEIHRPSVKRRKAQSRTKRI